MLKKKLEYQCANVQHFVGNDVVIVKNGRRICGTGAALSNAPIAQDKAYFEVKVQSTGRFLGGSIRVINS